MTRLLAGITTFRGWIADAIVCGHTRRDSAGNIRWRSARRLSHAGQRWRCAGGILWRLIGTIAGLFLVPGKHIAAAATPAERGRKQHDERDPAESGSHG